MENPLKWLYKNKANLFNSRTFLTLFFSLASILIISIAILDATKISYLKMNREHMDSLRSRIAGYQNINQNLTYKVIRLQSVLDNLTGKQLYQRCGKRGWRSTDLEDSDFAFRLCADPMREETERKKMEIQVESTRKFFKTFKDFDFSKNITNDEKPLNQIKKMQQSLNSFFSRVHKL